MAWRLLNWKLTGNRCQLWGRHKQYRCPDLKQQQPDGLPLSDSWYFFFLHISEMLILWQFHCFRDKKEYISFYLCLIFLHMYMFLWAIPSQMFFLLGAITICVLVCVDKLLICLRQNKKTRMVKEINSFSMHLPYINICTIALFLQQQDDKFFNEILVGRIIPVKMCTLEILHMYHKSWNG